MARRRRQRLKTMDGKIQSELTPNALSGRRGSVASTFKNFNKIGFSRQLKGMAEKIEWFEQMAELMTYVNILGSSNPGSRRGLNLGGFLKNGDSMNHLFKAILPVLRNAHLTEEISEAPKKVSPIGVDTHRPKKS